MGARVAVHLDSTWRHGTCDSYIEVRSLARLATFSPTPFFFERAHHGWWLRLPRAHWCGARLGGRSKGPT